MYAVLFRFFSIVFFNSWVDQAKLDTDAEREQQLAASVKELKRAERENAREIAALEKAQREWPSKIHQMTMGLRVKEDEVHKMVLRADAVR